MVGMTRSRGEYGSPWPYHAVIAGQPVMLARIQGEPSWHESKVKYFDQGALVTSTDRNYQMFPPEFEFPYAQEDWSGGAGHADQVQGVRNTYWYADGVDCSGGWPVRGPLVNTAPASISGSISQLIEFNSVLYCIADDRIYKRPDDVSAWTNITPSTDFPANVSGPCVVFQGTQSSAFLFIPIGSGNHYYVMSTGESFTQHASQNATGFEVVGNELWLSNKESNQQVIRKCEDGGTAATWGAAITAGDAVAPINNLKVVDNRLIAIKDNGLIGFSSDAFTVDEELTRELRGLSKAGNGRVATVWNGSLVFTMDGQLFRYAPATGELAQIGPELVDRNTSPVKGPIVAIDGQAGVCLWGVMYNAATGHSHLARYGSWRTQPGGAEFLPIWHYSLHKFTSKTVTTIFVSTGVYLGTPQPRLYVGCSDGTLYYFVLAKTSNVLDDPAYRYDTDVAGGNLYLTRYNALFPFESKLIKAIGLGGRAISGTSQALSATYKAASDSSYTSIGAISTEPGERIEVSGTVAAPAVDFVINFVTTTATLTPILTHFVIYATLRTTNLKEINATIVSGDNVVDLNGKPLRYTWRDIRDALEGAMTTTGPFSVINPAGESITVIGLDYAHGYSPTTDDEKRGQRWTESIRMFQTTAVHNRGTWQRAAAYTWGDLAAFNWAQVAVI